MIDLNRALHVLVELSSKLANDYHIIYRLGSSHPKAMEECLNKVVSNQFKGVQVGLRTTSHMSLN